MLLALNDKMYKKKTRKRLLRLTSLNVFKSKLMKNFFSKKQLVDCLMTTVMYLMKKLRKKFEVISYTKIFYIKFC